MTSIRVLAPGALTTVQDLGRPGSALLGVSAAGAADTLSLRVGNLLVGNPIAAAGLEMTLVGGTFELEGRCVVAVTGSDFGPTLESPSGARRSVPAWASFEAGPGDVLRLGPTRSGARCYLSVRGGIDVPPTLGSASTHLASGLGGLAGRALHPGDLLRVGSVDARATRRSLATVAAIEAALFRRVLRVTDGPQRDWFTADSIAAFLRSAWQVTEEADRMGLRLRGPQLHRALPGDLPTEGVCVGAIQVPDGGQPIVLFVDQQTTGGYPKIANVITADLPAIGQLRPRNAVRFQVVSLAEAHRLLREQERAVAAAMREP